MKKDIRSLDSGTAKNNIFLGDMDLCQGVMLSDNVADAMEYKLRLCAIFYDKLMLYDGFIHGYGPLQSLFCLEKLSNSQKRLKNTIKTFLKNGIITPIVRNEQTPYENWKNDIKGIKKGTMLCLPDDPNFQAYMQEISELASISFCKSIPNLGNNFRKSFFEYFLRSNQKTQIDELIVTSSEKYLGGDNKYICKFFDELKEKCSHVDKDKFRRGAIEDILCEIQNLPVNLPDKYDKFRALARYETGKNIISKQLCSLTLSSSATIYQVELANALGLECAMFDSHQSWIVDSGLSNEFRVVGQSSGGGEEMLLENKLMNENVHFANNFNALDVVRFRTEEHSSLFLNYLKYRTEFLKDVKLNARGFVKFITAKYLHEFYSFLVNTASKNAMRNVEPMEFVQEMDNTTGQMMFRLGSNVVSTFVFNRPVKECVKFSLHLNDFYNGKKWLKGQKSDYKNMIVKNNYGKIGSDK